MTLENQVCSLELSKRLKELRVEQDAYFTWYVNADKGNLMHNPEGFRGFESKSFDAFTVAELGELIPGNFDGKYCSFEWGMMHGIHYACLKNIENEEEVHIEEAKTEADARAKMLIYLLENNLLIKK